MGAGLLAGLGKGIAAAGSSFGDLMIRREMQREADARAERRALDAEAREDQRYKNRLQLTEDMEEAKRKRAVEQTVQAIERGQEIGTQRDATGLLGLANTLPQGELSGTMSEADLETIRNMPEEARRIYQESGAISTRDRRLQSADDMIQGAMESGAGSTVIEAFEKKRTAVLNEIKEENKVAKEEADRKDREARDERLHLQRMEEIRQRGKENLASIGARGSSGGSGESGNKPDTTLDLERRISTTLGNIAFELGVEQERVPSTVQRLRQAAERGDATAKASLEKIAPMLNRYGDLSRSMAQIEQGETPPQKADTKPDATDTPRGSTPPVSLLQAGKVTTFANGQKWTLRDGKAVQVK